MQIEHKEDRPSKQERSREKTRPPKAQPSLAAPLQEENPVETHSVEQCDENQNERTDADRGERLEFIRNLGQEGRNMSPALPRAVSHGSTS